MIKQSPALKAKGMSLVELLIAMTLGLILMTGMIAVFSGNKRSSELNTAMANLQENARFALGALSEDVRMAAYQGCLDARRGSLIVKSADAPVPLVGFETDGTPRHDFGITSATGAVVVAANQWEPAIIGGFTPPVVNPAIPGTHVLAVQYGSTNDSGITGPINVGGVPNPNGPIVTEDNLNLQPGDLAMIANCDNVDLFTVSAAAINGNGQTLEHTAPRNIDGSLSARYGLPNNIAQTRVMRFVSNIYYIGDTGLENDTGDQIRALYQQSFPYDDPENPPSELVQGIENMRLSFGIRTQNTLRYVTANDPLFDPARVESIQIGLIMTSWNAIAEQDDENTYVIAGQEIPPAKNSADGLTHAEDGRYRLVFNTTVKVRNRRENSVFMSQQVAPPSP